MGTQRRLYPPGSVAADRHDCESAEIEVIVAGADRCFQRHRDLCRTRRPSPRVRHGGTYDLSRYLDGRWNDDFYHASPLHYRMPEGAQLGGRRHRAGNGLRTVETQRNAGRHRRQSDSNRVDDWGGRYDHDWPTARMHPASRTTSSDPRTAVHACRGKRQTSANRPYPGRC